VAHQQELAHAIERSDERVAEVDAPGRHSRYRARIVTPLMPGAP
jgi:hypothetical protein